MAASKRRRNNKTYSPAEKKRRIRRHNTIVYIIAGLLIVSGIALIISDQTLFFPTVYNKVAKTIQEVTTGEKEILPTLPPFPMYTWDPNTTLPPFPDLPYYDPKLWSPYETAAPTPGATGDPGRTSSPSVTQEPNSTPRPSNPQPGPVTENPYAPKTIYFLDDYIQASISDIVCPVDSVGYNSQGHMDTVHSAFRAGWFRYGGDPAHGGNVLIAGHNRYSGRMGYFSVVKDKMQPGDIVIVEMQNGSYAYYMVNSITQYPYDEVPNEVMNTGGAPRLTLITCLGDYSSIIHTSRHRVIAVCTPVFFSAPDSNQTDEPIQTPEPADTQQPDGDARPEQTQEQEPAETEPAAGEP